MTFSATNIRLPYREEWIENLSLAITKKTMDYVLISYTICKFTYTILLLETITLMRRENSG